MKHSERFSAHTPKVVHETIDGEVVIVNLEKGDYYSLVKAGADIWDGLTSGMSRGEVLENIIQRYDGDRENIEKSVNDFIDQLNNEELIIIEAIDESKSSNSINAIAETNGHTEKLSFEPPSLNKYTDMEDLLALDPIHEVGETGWPNAKVGV